MKILNVIENFSEEGKKILETVGDVDYVNLTQEELVKKVNNYDVLVVRIGLDINKVVIGSGKNLKIIATATTGLNHIDVSCATQKGIQVLSLKDEVDFLDMITSTAELAFGLMIDLMRLSPWAFDSIKNYRLKLEEFRGWSLYGKTLGVVGMGRLGKIIAEGAAGWRMNVIFSDPNVPQEKFPEFKKVSFDELLGRSDAVTVHVHLLPETEKMFGAREFEKMKKTAYLINTARGELVDEAALLKALENKTIAGYGSDVLSNEIALVKNFSNHPLVEYAKKNQNCIIVPHTGGLTYDSRIATDVFIAKKLAAFLENILASSVT